MSDCKLLKSTYNTCTFVLLGCNVRGNCGKTLLDRLQKLQNRAARVLTFSCYDSDTGCLVQKLGWKNLCTQLQIQKASIVHKSLNGLAPEYLCSKFAKRNEIKLATP